jgi:hypothetical protein
VRVLIASKVCNMLTGGLEDGHLDPCCSPALHLHGAQRARQASSIHSQIPSMHIPFFTHPPTTHDPRDQYQTHECTRSQPGLLHLRPSLRGSCKARHSHNSNFPKTRLAEHNSLAQTSPTEKCCVPSGCVRPGQDDADANADADADADYPHLVWP